MWHLTHEDIIKALGEGNGLIHCYIYIFKQKNTFFLRSVNDKKIIKEPKKINKKHMTNNKKSYIMRPVKRPAYLR